MPDNYLWREARAGSVRLCSRGTETPAYADRPADLALRKAPVAETT